MRVTELKAERTGGGSRVEADVDGETLWFACEDTDLRPSPEAIVCALLIPAAHRGEVVEIDGELDRSFHDNLAGVQDLVGRWWNLPGTRVEASSFSDRPREAPGVKAQFFSGGVDSYFTLLGAREPPGILMFVRGYDMTLEDEARWEAFRPGFMETASAHGARPLVICSNLRQHHVMEKIDWGRTHGGALAAAGHLLSAVAQQFTVPPSYPYHAPRPWGTHWDLDPLWSSRQTTFRHGDASMRRPGKVRAIADNHLVMKHLRVCWENRSAAGNCSRCAKCVRTMLCLEMCGRLGDCEAFDRSRPVEKLIDEVPQILPRQIPAFSEMLASVEDMGQRAAVERLIKRSQPRRPLENLKLACRRLFRPHRRRT